MYVISICVTRPQVILINANAAAMSHVLGVLLAVPEKHAVRLKTTGMILVRAVISSVTTKTIRLNVNAATMSHVLRIATPVTKPETSMGVVYLILRPLPGFLSRNLGSEYL